MIRSWLSFTKILNRQLRIQKFIKYDIKEIRQVGDICLILHEDPGRGETDVVARTDSGDFLPGLRCL